MVLFNTPTPIHPDDLPEPDPLWGLVERVRKRYTNQDVEVCAECGSGTMEDGTCSDCGSTWVGAMAPLEFPDVIALCDRLEATDRALADLRRQLSALGYGLLGRAGYAAGSAKAFPYRYAAEGIAGILGVELNAMGGLAQAGEAASSRATHETVSANEVTPEDIAERMRRMYARLGGTFVGEPEPDWESIINALPDPVGAVERVLIGDTGAKWTPLEGRQFDTYPAGHRLSSNGLSVETGIYGWVAYVRKPSGESVTLAKGEDGTSAGGCRALLLAIAAGRVTLPAGSPGLAALLEQP